jgi:hypothetical protein
MQDLTQYRLFPSYRRSATGNLFDAAIMILQFCDYSGGKVVWRSVPKYYKHEEGNEYNLGDLLMAQEHREADSIVSVCPVDNPKDFRTRTMPMIEFALEDSEAEARQFIQEYPNVKDYLLDVLEQHVADMQRVYNESDMPEGQYDRKMEDLLIKHVHRVTYL